MTVERWDVNTVGGILVTDIKDQGTDVHATVGGDQNTKTYTTEEEFALAKEKKRIFLLKVQVVKI